MPGLATYADVTAGNGPAYGLMAYPDECGAFVDLVRKAGSLRGGTNEVGVDCFHTHRKALTRSCSKKGHSPFNRII